MLNISGNELSIDSALTFLEKSSKYLSPQHVKRLQSLTNSNSRTNDQNLLTVSDLELTDLDLLDELRSQMQVIKDLRETLSSTTDTKALQGLISSSNTLFTSIAKLREQVMKQESQRRLETATVAAIKTLEPLAQDKFFKTLETELGKAGA